MKKLLIFENNKRYVITPSLTMYPLGVTPLEEVSLELATNEEILSLRQNPHQDELIEAIKQRSSQG